MEFKKRSLHLVAAGLFAVPVIIIVFASKRNVHDFMFLILLVVPSVHIARYANKQN